MDKKMDNVGQRKRKHENTQETCVMQGLIAIRSRILRGDTLVTNIESDDSILLFGYVSFREEWNLRLLSWLRHG